MEIRSAPEHSVDGARQRIREIEAAGHNVMAVRLVDALSEPQALKLEALLIAAFGTVDTGGLLTNSVLPTQTHGSRAVMARDMQPVGGDSAPQLTI